MVRALGIQPGDKLVMTVRDGSMTLIKRPDSWVDHYAGIAEGLYGQSKEEIDEYLRESRGDWEPVEQE